MSVMCGYQHLKLCEKRKKKKNEVHTHTCAAVLSHASLYPSSFQDEEEEEEEEEVAWGLRISSPNPGGILMW